MQHVRWPGPQPVHDIIPHLSDYRRYSQTRSSWLWFIIRKCTWISIHMLVSFKISCAVKLVTWLALHNCCIILQRCLWPKIRCNHLEFIFYLPNSGFSTSLVIDHVRWSCAEMRTAPPVSNAWLNKECELTGHLVLSEALDGAHAVSVFPGKAVSASILVILRQTCRDRCALSSIEIHYAHTDTRLKRLLIYNASIMSMPSTTRPWDRFMLNAG